MNSIMKPQKTEVSKLGKFTIIGGENPALENEAKKGSFIQVIPTSTRSSKELKSFEKEIKKFGFSKEDLKEINSELREEIKEIETNIGLMNQYGRYCPERIMKTIESLIDRKPRTLGKINCLSYEISKIGISMTTPRYEIVNGDKMMNENKLTIKMEPKEKYYRVPIMVKGKDGKLHRKINKVVEEDVIFTSWKKEKNGELKGKDLLVLHNSGRLILPINGVNAKTNSITFINKEKHFDLENEGELLENVREYGAKVLIPGYLGKDILRPIDKLQRLSIDIRQDSENKIAENYISDFRQSDSKMGFVPIKIWNKDDHAIDIGEGKLTHNHVDYNLNLLTIIGTKMMLEGVKHRFEEKNKEIDFGYYNFTEQELEEYNPRNDFIKTRNVTNQRKVIEEDGSVKVVGLNNISDDEKSYLKRVNNPRNIDTSEYEEIIAIAQEQDGRLKNSNLEFEMRREFKYLKTKTAGELHFLLEYLEEEQPENERKHQALINVVKGFKSSAEIHEEEQKGLTADLKDLVTKEKDGFKANRKSKNLYNQQTGILSRNQNPQNLITTRPFSKGERRILREVNIRITKALNEEEEMIRQIKIGQDIKENYFEMMDFEKTVAMGGLRTSGLFHFPTTSSVKYNEPSESEYHHLKVLKEVIPFEEEVTTERNIKKLNIDIDKLELPSWSKVKPRDEDKEKEEIRMNKHLINNPYKIVNGNRIPITNKVFGLENVYDFKNNPEEIKELLKERRFKEMISSLLKLSFFPHIEYHTQSEKYEVIEKTKRFSIIKVKGIPQILYAKGNLDLLNQKSISIAGIRYPQEETVNFLKEAVKYLVNEDYVIISGLAKGCDYIAHDTCIDKGGKTIAVLPSGFNHVSPKENIGLARKILKNDGLILSQFDPSNQVKKSQYHERNETIARLSEKVLICEAGNGTMSTYNSAKKLGKTIFVQPINCRNNNNLIDNGEEIFLI